MKPGFQRRKHVVQQRWADVVFEHNPLSLSHFGIGHLDAAGVDFADIIGFADVQVQRRGHDQGRVEPEGDRATFAQTHKAAYRGSPSRVGVEHVERGDLVVYESAGGTKQFERHRIDLRPCVHDRSRRREIEHVQRGQSRYLRGVGCHRGRELDRIQIQPGQRSGAAQGTELIHQQGAVVSDRQRTDRSRGQGTEIGNVDRGGRIEAADQTGQRFQLDVDRSIRAGHPADDRVVENPAEGNRAGSFRAATGSRMARVTDARRSTGRDDVVGDRNTRRQIPGIDGGQIPHRSGLRHAIAAADARIDQDAVFQGIADPVAVDEHLALVAPQVLIALAAVGFHDQTGRRQRSIDPDLVLARRPAFASATAVHRAVDAVAERADADGVRAVLGGDEIQIGISVEEQLVVDIGPLARSPIVVALHRSQHPELVLLHHGRTVRMKHPYQTVQRRTDHRSVDVDRDRFARLQMHLEQIDVGAQAGQGRIGIIADESRGEECHASAGNDAGFHRVRQRIVALLHRDFPRGAFAEQSGDHTHVAVQMQPIAGAGSPRDHSVRRRQTQLQTLLDRRVIQHIAKAASHDCGAVAGMERDRHVSRSHPVGNRQILELEHDRLDASNHERLPVGKLRTIVHRDAGALRQSIVDVETGVEHQSGLVSGVAQSVRGRLPDLQLVLAAVDLVGRLAGIWYKGDGSRWFDGSGHHFAARREADDDIVDVDAFELIVPHPESARIIDRIVHATDVGRCVERSESVAEQPAAGQRRRQIRGAGQSEWSGISYAVAHDQHRFLPSLDRVGVAAA